MEIDTTKLLKLRLHKNVSQYKMANDIGVSKATICNIESGKNKNPKFSTLWDICEYFNISIISVIKTPRL